MEKVTRDITTLNLEAKLKLRNNWYEMRKGVNNVRRHCCPFDLPNKINANSSIGMGSIRYGIC